MKDKKPTTRQYPPFYEKAVPAVLGIIILVVTGLIIAAAGVVLGYIG